MKTAISLPDPLFKSADLLAARLGLARSELYARALAFFLADHAASRVTAQLNEIYPKHESRAEPAFARAVAAGLSGEDW